MLSVVAQIQMSITHPLKAWFEAAQVDSWTCHPIGVLKLNFDVAVRNSFMVAADVIMDHVGEIILAFAKKLPLLDINASEANAALLVVKATSFLFTSSQI